MHATNSVCAPSEFLVDRTAWGGWQWWRTEAENVAEGGGHDAEEQGMRPGRRWGRTEMMAPMEAVAVVEERLDRATTWSPSGPEPGRTVKETGDGRKAQEDRWERDVRGALIRAWERGGEPRVIGSR